MIFGTDFLDLAEVLAKSGSEDQWRSAVSRAYYGVFHEARTLFESLGFRVPRADQAHAYLWLRLSNCGDAQVQSAGYEMNRLRQDRNRADYDIKLTITQPHAVSVTKFGQRLVRILQDATQEPTRTQITDSMKTYERDILKNVTWRP